LREHGGVGNGVAQTLLGARGGYHDCVFLGKHERGQQRHDERRACTDKHGVHPFPGERPRKPESYYCAGRPVSGLALLARIAFPWGLHSGVLMRLDALTVAGAAQVALGATAPAVPVSRLPHPAERPGGHRLGEGDYKRGLARDKVMKYMQKPALLLDRT